MPDDYSPLAYTMSGRGNNQYSRRRRFGEQMWASAFESGQSRHPMEGIGNLAQALAGAWLARRAGDEEQEADKKRQDAFATAMSETDPQKRIAMIAAVDPALGARLSGQLAVKQAELAQQQQGFNSVASTYGGGASGGGQVQQAQLPPPSQQQSTAMAPDQAKAEAQKKIQYLVNVHNFTPQQATAMVANLFQESGFNPTATHDGGTGHGMGGWRLDRREALMREAQARGENPNDPRFQLDFYANELKTRPEFAQFQQAQNPQQLQDALMAYFRPAGYTPQNPAGGHGYNERVQYAQQFAPQSGPQIAQGDQNAPPAVQAPPGMPSVVAPPAIPDVPRPQPSQAIIDKHRALAQSGAYKNPGEMAAAIEAEVTREHQQARETAKMRYEQQSKLAEESRKPTEGQKAVDTAFGKDYAEWVAAGGSTDTQRQLAQLQDVVRNLNSGKTLTGPITGRLPDAVLSVTNPDAIATRNAVEEVVQRNLRIVLGSQFTAQEGENLIKRAYNPVLGEAENAKRVGRLLEQIKTAAEIKMDASRYYEQHGTLRGWNGRLPKMSDFDMEDRNTPSQDNLKKKYGLE